MRMGGTGRAGMALALALALAACGAPVTTVTPSPPPSQSPPQPSSGPTPAASASNQPVHHPPDLSRRPLIWFAPLPRQPGGPYDGSDDWTNLWQPGADWDSLAAEIDVFKLYGGHVVRGSSPQELGLIGQTLDHHGLGIAVETGPLFPTTECGAYVESFAGPEWRETMVNFRDTGGMIDIIALDEPWFYAHVYDGEQACHWPVERIAQGVAEFTSLVRTIFPDVVIGDIEPLPFPVDAAGLGEWIDAWTAAVGEPPAFLHLDVDYSRTGWPRLIRDITQEAHDRDVPIGVIAMGEQSDDSDQEWLQRGGARFNQLRFDEGLEPDHWIFQSWQDPPDRALPESDPTTYTGWLLEYLRDPHSELAVGATSSERNLALGRPVDVASELPGFPSENAVDGSIDSIWNSGEGPPQSITVDLGARRDIAEIRLTLSQYPAGDTVIRVFGRGSRNGDERMLHEFTGTTADGDVLSEGPAEAWTGIRLLRVQVVQSPSWVAFREIEALAL